VRWTPVLAHGAVGRDAGGYGDARQPPLKPFIYLHPVIRILFEFFEEQFPVL
jgi:hypothetical protein